MKKILVLDIHTNGHEAALAFIARQNWNPSECEIVFCGTHAKLLTQLTQGPSYAVVPIYNTTAKAGVVTEVTSKLQSIRDEGFQILEIDRHAFQIDHCLVVGQHVESADQLDVVLSHEKAVQQCGAFLERHGLSDKVSRSSSTGNAAKAIYKAGSHQNIGAIASKAAAEAYGLKILATTIQDVAVNETTFLILQNKAEVESVTVGIIGIEGRFGQTLKTFFESIGCTVIGSDRETLMRRAEVVRLANVIVFAVPVKVTENLIDRSMPHVRADQLIMDITSVKSVPTKRMLKGAGQVLGLHPMFKPSVPFEGQTIVACAARLTDPRWRAWAMNMLARTGAKIKWSTPEEHDRTMVTVQSGPHTASLTSALVIARSGVPVAESLDFTSPFYKILFAQMGRLVIGDPGLYSAIAIENPLTAQMLERRIEIEQEMLDIVQRKDYGAFERLFKEAREHFGSSVTSEADKLFNRIIALMATLDGKKSTRLQFLKSQSKPGLLARITKVFAGHDVNLTGIHSVPIDDKHIEFSIGFENDSDAVRGALDEIEGWKDIQVRVVE